MEAQVRIGANRRFVLRNAVLIYGDGSGAFATLHEVRGEKEGAPYPRSRPIADDSLPTLAGARAWSANGTGDPAGEHPRQNAGFDCLVDQGAASVHVLRRRKRRGRKAEWPDVSPSGFGIQDLGPGSLSCVRLRPMSGLRQKHDS